MKKNLKIECSLYRLDYMNLMGYLGLNISHPNVPSKKVKFYVPILEIQDLLQNKGFFIMFI